MSLFDTDTPVATLASRRATHLPAATRDRFMPLRAGIVNVWEYDDQQFWFADGRLLLRGRNEAGKSKVLELLFPFVLDGDITPKKLDPFDTANKSMWWNMIGFSKDRDSAIGYLWIEFGRRDPAGQAEYLTAIVGVQATRKEHKVTTWFGLTPQRVGADLDLTPGDVCRPQDSFAKALSPTAMFETRSSAHRANVGRRLFDMTPERFDNLLHLLRQLRKPKLADKLDNKKLSEVLTQALPPLDETRIEPLAAGFAFLDADVQALDRAEKALRATQNFLDSYRAYARGQARYRAGRVVQTVTNFDNVTREERQAVQSLSDARTRSTNVNSALESLALEFEEASGSLDALDQSAVDNLHSLEQQAAADRHLAEQAGVSASRAATVAARVQKRSLQASKTAEALKTKLSNARLNAERAATRAGLEADWATASQDTQDAAAALNSAVRARRHLIDTLAAADQRAVGARQKLALTNAALEAAAQQLAAEADKRAEAQRICESAEESFASHVDSWLDASPAQMTGSAADIIAAVAGMLTGGDRQVRQLAASVTAEGVAAAERAVRNAAGAEATAAADKRRAERELQDHDAQPGEIPPAVRPGVPAERHGVPLWQSVEFSAGVDPTEAAQLEAALDASGLLDALVSVEGLRSDDDTIIVASSATGAGVRDWLRPAEGADFALVDAILAGIGAGALSGSTCWVDVDGSWANGPLQGRWSKPVAEHIGAAARAATRARRRAELVAAAETASEAHHQASELLAQQEAARSELLAWRDEFPSVADWAAAQREAGRCQSEEAKATRQHQLAYEAHSKELAASRAALKAVDDAAAAAGCGVADIPAVRQYLDVAAEQAAELGAVDAAVTAAAEQALSLAADAAACSGEHAQARAEHQVRERAAARSGAAYREMLELQGADVKKILAEKERLESQVVSLTTRRQRLEIERGEARDAVVRAEAVLDETGRRRETATAERDSALSELASLVRSGHVGHVVALDASRDPADYTQATAGRTLARQLSAAVPPEEGGDAARSRSTDRLVSAYSPLQEVIGAAFDPHLESTDTGVFSASATLNGEVVGIADLHRALQEDVAQRRTAIEGRERQLIEQYLADEVGNHLGDCLHAAKSQVNQMNAILKAHPTNSGATVHLNWQVQDDAGPGVKEAVAALLTSPTTRYGQASSALAVFLAERVAMARRGDVDGANLAERLLAALDYRRWHNFVLAYRSGAGTDAALTAKSVGTGSGGQQAKIAHLPLLAAAAGFYSSSPAAPRLCFLDEAFAGIDGPNTADLLAVTATLGLDMVMTNFDAWFCYPQVPGLAIYHLEKLAGQIGVAAIRYEWDGAHQHEIDPWLDL